MTIKQILNEQIENLKESSIEDGILIAKILLSFLLKTDKIYLVINQDSEINDEVCYNFRKLVDEIIQGKPLQYIIRNQEFMGLNFYVDENVLIPQPDTEILVQEVINICNKSGKDRIKILDLCTGSGAIAISIYKNINIKNKEVYGSDISEKALEVAKMNNTNNDTTVTFIKSDLFNNISEKNFDIIVSNPPYIETEKIKTLSKQVKSEPILALDGGEDGLNFYRDIIKETPNYLKKGGFLFLEIGYNQKESVTKLLYDNGLYKNIEVFKDISLNDRCIISVLQ